MIVKVNILKVPNNWNHRVEVMIFSYIVRFKYINISEEMMKMRGRNVRNKRHNYYQYKLKDTKITLQNYIIKEKKLDKIFKL